MDDPPCDPGIPLLDRDPRPRDRLEPEQPARQGLHPRRGADPHRHDRRCVAPDLAVGLGLAAGRPGPGALPVRLARGGGGGGPGRASPSGAHIWYVTPRLVVTALPVTDDGRLVLLRRGIEPGLGSWAQPGGFLEVDETVGEAAVRETLEETGLLVRPGEIVGLYPRLEGG